MGRTRRAGRCSAVAILRRGSRRSIWLAQDSAGGEWGLGQPGCQFEVLYIDFCRPSIPPERLIRASLIQILFSVRSGRRLMEQMQMQYNLLFRWFVCLGIDDPVWVPTVFTKNRDPAAVDGNVAQGNGRDPRYPEVAPLRSDDHLSVDGTLVNPSSTPEAFLSRIATTKLTIYVVSAQIRRIYVSRHKCSFAVEPIFNAEKTAARWRVMPAGCP